MTEQKVTLKLQNSLAIAEMIFLYTSYTVQYRSISNVPNYPFEKVSFISNKNDFDIFSWVSGFNFFKIAPNRHQK